MPSYCLKAHLTAKAVTSGGEHSQHSSSQPGAHSAKAKHIPVLLALSAAPCRPGCGHSTLLTEPRVIPREKQAVHFCQPETTMVAQGEERR